MSQNTSGSCRESRAPWYLVAFANATSLYAPATAGSIHPIVIPYNSVVLCMEACDRLHARSPHWCAVCIPGDEE